MDDWFAVLTVEQRNLQQKSPLYSDINNGARVADLCAFNMS